MTQTALDLGAVAPTVRVNRWAVAPAWTDPRPADHATGSRLAHRIAQELTQPMGETPTYFLLPFPYRFNQPTRTDRKRLKVKLKAAGEKVTIKWFVWAGDVKMPYESSMRGTWGWDATCSCGWQTRTGGAVRSSVLESVQDHKKYEHGYEYDFQYDFAAKETK
jgi:hypothetical protein